MKCKTCGLDSDREYCSMVCYNEYHKKEGYENMEGLPRQKNHDFRAFRRQVLLALVRSENYSWGSADDVWKDADGIARAEPKE